MDEEINKLRESIGKLKAERDSFEKSWKENIRIKETTVTIEEARKIYQSGEATLEEFQEYAGNRSGVERAVIYGPEIISGTNELIQAKEKQLKELEAKKRAAERTPGKIALSIILLASLCAILVGFFVDVRIMLAGAGALFLLGAVCGLRDYIRDKKGMGEA